MVRLLVVMRAPACGYRRLCRGWSGGTWLSLMRGHGAVAVLFVGEHEPVGARSPVVARQPCLSPAHQSGWKSS